MPVDRIDGAGWVMPQGVVVAKVAQLTFHATMTVAPSDQGSATRSFPAGEEKSTR